jgi:hypothetical protein
MPFIVPKKRGKVAAATDQNEGKHTHLEHNDHAEQDDKKGYSEVHYKRKRPKDSEAETPRLCNIEVEHEGNATDGEHAVQ